MSNCGDCSRRNNHDFISSLVHIVILEHAGTGADVAGGGPVGSMVPVLGS